MVDSEDFKYDAAANRLDFDTSQFDTSEAEGKTEHKRFLWQGLRMLREETSGQSSLYLYEPGSYAPLARVDKKEGEGQQKL